MIGSDDKLRAHNLLELDLSLRDGITHLFSGSSVLIIHARLLATLIGDNISLFLLERLNRLPQLVVLLLQRLDLVVHVSLGLVGDQCLLQTIGNGAIIELLQVSLDHSCLVTHTHQLIATLNTVQSDLANDLIEALGVEFLTNGADTLRSCAQVIELLVETMLQI